MCRYLVPHKAISFAYINKENTYSVFWGTLIIPENEGNFIFFLLSSLSCWKRIQSPKWKLSWDSALLLWRMDNYLLVWDCLPMIDFVGPAQIHERHVSSGVCVHLTCILKCLTYKSFPQAIDFTVHGGNR